VPVFSVGELVATRRFTCLVLFALVFASVYRRQMTTWLSSVMCIHRRQPVPRHSVVWTPLVKHSASYKTLDRHCLYLSSRPPGNHLRYYPRICVLTVHFCHRSRSFNSHMLLVTLHWRMILVLVIICSFVDCCQKDVKIYRVISCQLRTLIACSLMMFIVT